MGLVLLSKLMKIDPRTVGLKGGRCLVDIYRIGWELAKNVCFMVKPWFSQFPVSQSIENRTWD